jgi:predicted RNA-binding protein with PUA-like domain
MKTDDRVIIYHSNANPSGIVGVARVVVEATIDPTQFEEGNKYQDVSSKPESPKWWGVHIEPVQKLRMISLKELQNMEELRNSALCKKGNRLSVIELSEDEYTAIINKGRVGNV